MLTIWVCESKHFAEGVGVNDHGEWVTFYGDRPRGIPSPIEQNRRHIAVLEDVFDQKLVEPTKRLGITIKPQLKSVILVSNNARISRPKGKAAAAAVDGLDTVMKVDAEGAETSLGQYAAPAPDRWATVYPLLARWILDRPQA